MPTVSLEVQAAVGPGSPLSPVAQGLAAAWVVGMTHHTCPLGPTKNSRVPTCRTMNISERQALETDKISAFVWLT